MLCVIDFIKTELEKVKRKQAGREPDKTAEDIHLFCQGSRGERGKGCQNNQNKTKRKLKSYRAVVFLKTGVRWRISARLRLSTGSAA